MPCLLGFQRYTKTFWEKTPVVRVDSIPFDINGEAVYQVPYQKDKRIKAGCPWDRDMPIKWKGAKKEISTLSAPKRILRVRKSKMFFQAGTW